MAFVASIPCKEKEDSLARVHHQECPGPFSHLKDGHLLSVAQDPEGKGVSGPEAWGHLAAAEGDGIHMCAQIIAILVKIECATLEAAPAFLPALAHQHVQVA